MRVKKNTSAGFLRLNEYQWLIGLNAKLRQIPASAGKTRSAVQSNQPFPIQTRKSWPGLLLIGFFLAAAMGAAIAGCSRLSLQSSMSADAAAQVVFNALKKTDAYLVYAMFSGEMRENISLEQFKQLVLLFGDQWGRWEDEKLFFFVRDIFLGLNSLNMEIDLTREKGVCRENS